jgi:hypothetical protein
MISETWSGLRLDPRAVADAWISAKEAEGYFIVLLSEAWVGSLARVSVVMGSGSEHDAFRAAVAADVPDQDLLGWIAGWIARE